MASQGPIAQHAFPKWLQLLGIDAREFAEEAEAEPGDMSLTLGEMDRMQQAIALSDCLSLPDGELTAQMMLSSLLDSYLEDHSFTLAEMLREPGMVQQTLDLVKSIRTVLNRDDVVLSRAQFTETMEAAVAHYGAQDRQDVREAIEDDATMALLRRSALSALHDLSTSQFLQGDPGPLVRPQYSTVIRRWWSVDQMLAAHATIPEGVSLNLVKTPADHDVFFCFVVRRGANLYVLNDAPDYEHPLQSQMSRRPDRRMAERVHKFWFPYDLADVVMSEDGREARVSKRHQSRAQGLERPDRITVQSQVVGAINDLPPHELLWAVMMFDLIMDRFWSPHPLPVLPLSYTATQLLPQGQMLLESAKAAGLPVVAGAPGHLVVPELSVHDIAALHAAPDAAHCLGETGDYASLRWLEARYADKIPQTGLDPVDTGTAVHLLGVEGRLEMAEGEASTEVSVVRRSNENAVVPIHAMEATRFGTAEQLRADRSFLARNNYARAIGALARQEYAKRRDEVREWLSLAYTKRIEFLKSLAPAAYHHAMDIVDWEPGQGPAHFRFNGGYKVTLHASIPGFDKGADTGCTHRLAWVADMSQDSTAFMPYLRQGSEPERSWKPLCQVTGQKASYFLAVKPTNAQELAWLLGMDTSELPDVLQQHSALSPEGGNSILDRIDPMLWALKNPWHDLNLGARLGLSKRGLSQLMKEHPPTVDVSHLHGANLRAFVPPAPSRARPHP